MSESHAARRGEPSQASAGEKAKGQGQAVEQLVAYQVVFVAADAEQLDAQLLEDLGVMGKQKVRVVRQKVTPLSSRWTSQQIQSEMPWVAAPAKRCGNITGKVCLQVQ